MLRLRLDRGQRSLLADKLSDVGNLAAGALIFGQALGEQSISLKLLAAGLVTWIVFLGLSVVWARESKR